MRTRSVSACLFDTNAWIAALFPTHSFHSHAQAALRAATPANAAVFCRSTEQSFLRPASTEALLRAYGAVGLTNRHALIAMADLLALPQVCERDQAPGTAALWHRLASRNTASPKLWMDAYLAAFAISGAMRMVSLDHDFKTFEKQGLDLVLLDR